MQSGPSLIFLVMTGIFSKLPGGRLIGICFFLAIVFAVISSLFTFFEISIRTFEDNLKMGRIKATLIISLIIGAGNIIVSLGFGVLSGIKLPWWTLPVYPILDSTTGLTHLPDISCFRSVVFLSVSSYPGSGDLKNTKKNLRTMASSEKLLYMIRFSLTLSFPSSW